MYATETTIYIALVTAVVTIGVIMGYFILSMVKLHRKYLRLHNSRNEANVLVLEKERTRIVADLHDDLGPVLSAAKFKITEVEPPSADDQELLNQAAAHIDTIITRIRQISNGLIPGTLSRKGPLYAIQEFIVSVTGTFPVKIEFAPFSIPGFSEEQAIHLYRILQEVIHNTIKHSKATQLFIYGYFYKNDLVILCRDDGIGFNVKQVSQEKKGLGLQHLLTRTEMLRGSMYVETAPGQGTKYTFGIPLNKINKNDGNN